MSLFSSLIAFNRRCCRIIEHTLPAGFTRHLHTTYKFEVARLIDRRPGQVVVDIGGGKECPFLRFITDREAHCVIALDCSPEELRANAEIENKVVADAAGPSLPFASHSVDLVVSRSVVEHLPDNEAFFKNCAEVLRPGGMLVHTFPGRFAPFAMLNQILPNWTTRRLIRIFHPQWIDSCGYPAHYDLCYYSAIRDVLHREGFRDAQFTFRYYQSIYFDFCLPLYLVMLAYDLVIAGLGVRSLACGILVSAAVPAPLPEAGVREDAEVTGGKVSDSQKRGVGALAGDLDPHLREFTILYAA